MKRLFEDGIITTILGVLLIAGGGYMYITEKSDIGAGALIATGLIFLRSRDSLIGLGK